jgi:hypothetical protein
MRTAWVGRKEQEILRTVDEPDYTGGDVAEVCALLAA